MTPGSRTSDLPRRAVSRRSGRAARPGVAQRLVAREPRSPAASGAPREQLQLITLADRGPTVVHAELGVDVLLVGAHGVQGHHKLTGDLGAAEVSAEKAEHVQLP